MKDEKYYAYSQMKAILIPIKAIWFMLIANGKKKLEVRKNMSLYKAIKNLIKEYGYALIYFYVTKGLPHLSKTIENEFEIYDETQWDKDWIDFNGKVVARFKCYDVEEIFVNEDEYLNTDTLSQKELLEQSCLTEDEVFEYFGEERMMYELVFGCAIHISNLEIFDRPKELGEFKQLVSCPKNLCETCIKGQCKYLKSLTKAPQNYCYIEVGG